MSTNAIFIAMEEKVRAATILKLTGERKKKIELQKLEDSGKAQGSDSSKQASFELANQRLGSLVEVVWQVWKRLKRIKGNTKETNVEQLGG